MNWDTSKKWKCEQHPDKEFPHDDCTGPGIPDREYIDCFCDGSGWWSNCFDQWFKCDCGRWRKDKVTKLPLKVKDNKWKYKTKEEIDKEDKIFCPYCGAEISDDGYSIDPERACYYCKLD